MEQVAGGLSGSGALFLGLGWITILAFSFFCLRKVLRAQSTRRQTVEVAPTRERWGSRLGIILAAAGSAIGLGNFLRFPVQAAANGGGAFMIPYFCALVFLGVPLVWVEWTMGRFGGARGHGTSPGQFQSMWKHPAAKYFGVLGLVIPFGVSVYYVLIEAWMMGFTWFSATSAYFGKTTRGEMEGFLKKFQGTTAVSLADWAPVLVFLALTFALNYLVLCRGLARGIELLAKIGIPVLFVFGIILVVRALTLGAPDPAHPDWDIVSGLGFVWNPDTSRMGQAGVWLAAAGQVFFTLSLGQGILNCYASYVSENDDVALNGLTTSSLNEVAEVILGGTIAIPVAVAFFGLAGTAEVARGGAFDLGFQTLPLIFQKIPLGAFFGAVWFGLLFIAGITSSVGLIQPLLTFLEDELKWSRRKAVNATFAVLASCTLLVLFFFRYGVLNEMDFWVGTFGISLLAAFEIVLFSWVFGVGRGWEELHRGADIRVPRFFRFVLQWVTPVLMLSIFCVWAWQDAWNKLTMKGERPEDVVYLWGARLLLVAFFVAAVCLVRTARGLRERETVA